MDIVSDAVDRALARRLHTAVARGGGRGAMWVVSVTGMDGLAHEVLVDGMAVGEPGCVAVCGAAVVPAALVAPPGRRCGACTACPVVDPTPDRTRTRGFTRAMRRRAAAWLHLSCGATSGFGSFAGAGTR